MAASSLFRKTLHTLGTIVFGQGASIVAGIITAHAYGPAGRAVLQLAGLLIAFAPTTADGIRDAVAYQIGRQGRDPQAVWGTALRVLTFAAPLCAAILYVLWRITPAQSAYGYAAIAFPFALYVQSVGVLYLLRDRVERINTQNAATIGGGLYFVQMALVLIFHAPISWLMWAWVGAWVAAAILGARGVRELIGGAPKLRVPDLMGEQLGYAYKTTLSSNITYLALRADAFIITVMLSPALLGIYTTSIAAAEVTFNVTRAVLWSSFGRIATLEYADSAALCARIVRSSVAFQAVCAIGLFVTGPWLIVHVYGPRFAECGTVMRVLLPGVVFYSADGMLSTFIAVRSGRPGLLLAFECVTLALTASITFASIARLGLVGGALAHTVAYIVAYAGKSIAFLRMSGLRPSDLIVPRFSDLPYAIRRRLRPASS